MTQAPSRTPGPASAARFVLAAAVVVFFVQQDSEGRVIWPPGTEVQTKAERMPGPARRRLAAAMMRISDDSSESGFERLNQNLKYTCAASRQFGPSAPI